MNKNKLPDWIKVKKYNKQNYIKTSDLIKKNDINTVCVEANCPNRYECFSKKTATFMILGNICTRNCKYCNVKKGKPGPVDNKEPKKIADAVKKLGLKYVVITCVTRDDIEDHGISQFVKTIKEIRKIDKYCKIEILISDLNGNCNSLKKVLDEKPYVLNHNIEIVKNLFPKLRPKGSFETSIELLKKAKEIRPRLKTKSGFMIGLGETKKQIFETLIELRNADCDIVTIGQYLQPSKNHALVKKYYSPKEFEDIENQAKKIGISKVISGPLVRSSYKADKLI